MKRFTTIAIYTLAFVIGMWHIAMAMSLLQGGMWASGLCAFVGAAGMPVMAQRLRIKLFEG